MIKIYDSPSCTSCRKVKKWFKDQNIIFSEKNILSGSLTKEDIKEILEKSLEGTEEIISPRSKIMKEKNINVNDMSLNELYEFIKNNPTVLKRPIIVADNRIQVGYNEEDIYEFIPKAKRIAQMYCSSEHCPTYNTCQHRIDSCGGDENC